MGLDEKAIAAVSQWKFEPALKDGRPVPVQINVEVKFPDVLTIFCITERVRTIG